MQIKDRIKELRRVKASELLPSPKNWRTHPQSQKDALKGLLADVGFANAVLARETSEGLMLIDGHLRTETMGQSEIPVLILDVSEDEANKILLTADPLSAMADANVNALDELMREVETGSEAVAKMLTDLAEKHKIIDLNFEPGGINDQGKLDQLDPILITCPHCHKEFNTREV